MSDRESSKKRNQIVIGTNFAFLTISVFSSIQLESTNIVNQGHAEKTPQNIPVGYTPFYADYITITGQNSTNANQVQVSLSGIGNLTLPNSTETIHVNSTGSALVNFETTSVIAQEMLTKEDGRENASATIYEITRRDVKTLTEKGVVRVIF